MCACIFDKLSFSTSCIGLNIRLLHTRTFCFKQNYAQRTTVEKCSIRSYVYDLINNVVSSFEKTPFVTLMIK